MFHSIESLKLFLTLSIGATIGSGLRFYLTTSLQRFTGSGSFGTLVVNTIASFLLGLILSLEISSPLALNELDFHVFMIIGFLGSLSTFSTFVYDSFGFLNSYRFKEFFIFLSLSIIGGLLAISAGYSLGTFL